MKVLVTGGAGFIGSHAVDCFIAAGHDVAVIDNLESGSIDNLSDHAQFFQQDICDPEAKHTVEFLKPDLIVHTAAQMSVSDSMKNPMKDIRVNIEGTINLLSACTNELKPYIIFLSTGGAIYGEQEEFPASETHPKKPTSVYGLSKHAVEQYLDFWQRIYGLNYSVLRLANVYGPRQNPHGEAGVISIFLRLLLTGEQPIINGTGNFTRDYVYVGDVANAIVKASQVKPRNGSNILNIGTALETSVNDLYKLIQNSGNFSTTAVYGSQRAGDQSRSVINPNLANEVLHWKPQIDLETGIKETYQWFKEQYSSEANT